MNSKFLGLIAMGAAIAILFVLPWLDRSPVKSMRYKGNFSRIALLVFSAAFVILGYLGVKSPTPGRTALAQICTVIYFAYFLAMPYWTTREKCRPEPERVQPKGLSAGLVWGGFILFLAMTIIPIKAVGSEGLSCGTIECDVMEPDLTNKASLQRGAKYFTSYCMGCHSAKYSRFGRVADDLDIPHDLMMDTLVQGDQRIGDLMTIPMDSSKSKAWFGATPPDLTLVARARSPEWLYTYLRNFYVDESRPTGVNNKVFDKVAMPHVMMELQGVPECAPGPKLDSHGQVERDDLGEPVMDEACGSLKVGAIKGSMDEEAFDRATYDLVNFLEYVAEPIAETRKNMGIYVLLFILLLFVFTYLLNREYWKDVH